MGIVEELHSMPPPGAIPDIIRSKPESQNQEYFLHVNLLKIAQLLKARGISDERISSLKIHVFASEGPLILQKPFAMYLFSQDSLFILPQNILSDYNRLVELAKDIVEGKSTQSARFDDLLTTKRLSEYLQSEQYPKTRRISFAMKLLWEGTQRRISPLIAHELQHKIDYENNRTAFKLILIMERLFPFLGLLAPKLMEYVAEVVTGNEVALGAFSEAVYFAIAILSFYILHEYAYVFSYLERSARQMEQEVQAAGKDIVLGKLYPGDKNQFLADPWHQVKES